MAWTEHPIDGWTAFHNDVIQTLSANASPLHVEYVYRGQSSSEWSLSPSLTRLVTRLQYSRAKALEIERQVYHRFKERAHLHLEQRFLPPGVGSVLEVAALREWWSLMQHHRAPTRLLDWTHSPLVALYFAVRDHWEANGAVWCIHRPMLVELSNKRFGSAPAEIRTDEATMWWTEWPQQRVYAFDSQRPTDRIVSQRGAFTIAHDLLADHADVFTDTMAEESTIDGRTTILRRKYVIAAAAKRDLLRRLNQMNVGASGLFPGIDGFGSEIDEIVRLG